MAKVLFSIILDNLNIFIYSYKLRVSLISSENAIINKGARKNLTLLHCQFWSY